MRMQFDCRSALFMPGSNARALAKSKTLAADAILIDLEDSVGPNEKALARQQAVQCLQQTDFGYRITGLRINTDNEQWRAQDIEAAAQAKPDVLVLPKVKTAADVEKLCADMCRFKELEACAIWAMMETPQAVINANDIAASGKQNGKLAAFLIGSNDLALACGTSIRSDRTYLVPWFMSLVLAAKANDLLILDSVYNNIGDTDAFAAECAQAVDMGMNGKTLIHPSQLAIANQAFSPSEEELLHAQAIVQAFDDPDNRDKGVISLDGQMTERLHLEMAKALLQRAEILSARV